jgi:hypothetical protein
MSSFQQQVFGFIGITGLYLGVLALAFPGQLNSHTYISVGVTLALFILSTLVTSTGKVKNPESNAQKFILGTTVQMLAALFFILGARFMAPNHFRSMALHFLVLFFAFLIIQAFFLVKRARRS